jgi:hypothetical protein
MIHKRGRRWRVIVDAGRDRSVGAKRQKSLSVASYRGYIDRAIRPTLGKPHLSRVDAATLDVFHAHLRKQGGKGGRPMAASSVHQVHAISRAPAPSSLEVAGPISPSGGGSGSLSVAFLRRGGPGPHPRRPGTCPSRP